MLDFDHPDMTPSLRQFLAAQGLAPPPKVALQQQSATIPRTQTIRIDGWHPTPANKLVGYDWRTVAGRKAKDRQTIAKYSAGLRKADGKREVKLTLGLGPRQRGVDPDSPWKSLLDSLKHAEMLVDDSDKWVRLLPVEYVRAKPRVKRTVIELRDI